MARGWSAATLPGARSAGGPGCQAAVAVMPSSSIASMLLVRMSIPARFKLPVMALMRPPFSANPLALQTLRAVGAVRALPQMADATARPGNGGGVCICGVDVPAEYVCPITHDLMLNPYAPGPLVSCACASREAASHA